MAASLPFAHRRTAAEVKRCKRSENTDVRPSEWGKSGYAARPEVLTRSIEYDSQTVPIPRYKRPDCSPEWFYEHVASKQQPAIVEGACSHWPAMERWSLDRLEDRFRHVSFKVGENDKGKKIRMKFKYYADYVRHQADDNPLYLFETEIGDDVQINRLEEDFEVPDLFPHDWLNLMNQDSRPPYKWWCIGPKRSGTTVHTDPLGTSAWNAVTHGCKRWVLFEPSVSKRVAKGKWVKEKSEDDEAIHYFDFLLPRIKKQYPEVRIYEGLQNPGDVIFVPGGWWHGVLNIEDSVAVTMNYCGPDNFEMVWQRVRKDREKVAHLWLRNMRKFAPELYNRALAMNERDNFRMRHQRGKGEKLQNESSSSSDSTDSTSDTAVDLGAPGVEGIISPGLVLGPCASRGKRPRRELPMGTEGKRQRHSGGGEVQLSCVDRGSQAGSEGKSEGNEVSSAPDPSAVA